MPHFTLKQLEIFIAVAKYLSISDAARVLHLTQPAVSQQIHKIEICSNQLLFEQVGRKIYLTDEGNHFLKQAKKVIEQAELLKASCIAGKKIIDKKLKLSVSIPLQIMFFKILQEFNHQHSLTSIEFLESDRDIQLQSLYENKIDFCIMIHPVNKVKLTCELMTELPMSFIMSPHNQLANEKNISLQTLFHETFIICEEESANYKKLHELFEKFNNKPQKLIQIKDQNAIKYAVMANLGISILPDYMLQLELKHHLLVALIINEFTNPITAAYWVQHADKKLSPFAQSFKTFLFNELKKVNKNLLGVPNTVSREILI